MWILLTAIYGILIGIYSVTRKKASDQSSIIFMIALSSTFGFLLISWTAPEAFATDWQGVLLFLLKALIVFMAWIFELIAFKNYYMSSLKPISAIRVVISFVVSLIIFNEPVIWWKFFGVVVIFVGLLLLNYFDRKQLKNILVNKEQCFNRLEQKRENDNLNRKRILAIIFFILSCCLNVISGILDKLFLDSYTPSQMQFWFIFFIAVLGWIAFFVLCIKNKKILITKKDWKNWLIYLSGAILIIADRLLFIALTDPNVLVSGVSILKQLSTVISVIFGGILYKEPNLKYKIVFVVFILVGIVIVLV